MESADIMRSLLEPHIGEVLTHTVLACLTSNRRTTLRANTLKSTPEKVAAALSDAGIAFDTVEWSREAMIIKNARENKLRELSAYKNGEIYLQSLSSMIPPIIIAPKAGEAILDMAAAPGGKTTQMAALSGGMADITACEKNKVRAERLKYNLIKQGAGRVSVIVSDACRLDDLLKFDKILLDAPCSGSGTLASPEVFSIDLYERSIRYQRKLISKALRLLRPGGELLYSTCSVLWGENDGIVADVLRGGKARLIPIADVAFEGVPRLPSMQGTLTVCPTDLYEGFFAAHIQKL